MVMMMTYFGWVLFLDYILGYFFFCKERIMGVKKLVYYMFGGEGILEVFDNQE